MTENIYHYSTRLPDGFKEAVLVCPDGYTVYTDDSLSREERIEAYNHAIQEHIFHDDFNAGESADRIELRAHSRKVPE